MTKEQILIELQKFDLIGKGRIIIKKIDYSSNRFSPESVAYRIHYTNYSGVRRKVTYYPNTVGFQWS